MAEIITNTRNKRRIWIAVMLSLIFPGLGQIYCGRLARGLLLSILNTVPVSLIFIAFLFENMLMLILVTVGLTLFGITIQLIAIIDSIYLVKSIGPDYKLKDYNRWYVYLLLILMSGGCGSTAMASYVKSNILEAFVITTDSDYPTAFRNDRILANKIVYRKADPQRGDMVFYVDPANRQRTRISRVVAVAGDTVEMKDNQLYINGQMLERQPLSPTEIKASKINVHDPNFQGDMFYEINNGSKYKIFLSKTAGDEGTKNFPQITVPKYNYFVLGDNRNNSNDSRDFGLVPIFAIKARADWLYCPVGSWSRFGRLNAE